MEDDDEAEMRRMRKSQMHQAQSTTASRKQQLAAQKQALAAGSNGKDADTPQVVGEDDEDAALRQFMGVTEFGKKTKQSMAQTRALLDKTKRSEPPPKPAAPAAAKPAPRPAHEEEEDFVGPPRPSGPPAPDSDDEKQAADANGTGPSKYTWELPLSHEITLKGHSKAISALALDPSGARLLSGGLDYEIRFWDFAGMDSSLRAFKSIEPSEGHAIHTLDYSLSGELFVASLGSPQAKIYDRDGKERAEFVRGDMYLSDLANTKGHVAAVCGAYWHPIDKSVIMTGGGDGTIRFWNAENVKKQTAVIKVKNARNTRGNVTCCSYSPDGKLVGAAGMDGSVQIYDAAGPHHRPAHYVQHAHAENTETSSIKFSRDQATFITRGGDNTLKVWDIRRVETPIKVFDGLQNFFNNADCLFSPNDKLIVAGTSVKKKEGSGVLLLYDKSSLSLVRRVGISEASVVRILWHPKLNQILVGSADSSVHVLYDPDISHHGALLCATRAPRKTDAADFELTMGAGAPIYTPNALPLFSDEMNELPAAKKRALDRKDPAKSHKPDVGTAKDAPTLRNAMSQHLIRNYITIDTTRAEDPREAVLKYAKLAEEEPRWFGVYKTTQPVPIFQPHPTEEEDAEHAAAIAADAQKREKSQQDAARQAEQRKKRGF